MVTTTAVASAYALTSGKGSIHKRIPKLCMYVPVHACRVWLQFRGGQYVQKFGSPLMFMKFYGGQYVQRFGLPLFSCLPV